MSAWDTCEEMLGCQVGAWGLILASLARGIAEDLAIHGFPWFYGMLTTYMFADWCPAKILLI